MEKIDKFIKKLNLKKAERIYLIIDKIINRDLKNIDIRKLKGYSDIYRARVGKYRIIYTDNQKEIRILEISKRNDQTYKKF
jgi:mRNA interferase RelE/StbE